MMKAPLVSLFVKGLYSNYYLEFSLRDEKDPKGRIY